MSNKEVQMAYNNICEQWNDFCLGRDINKCIVDFERSFDRHSKVLDIGCGTGYPIAKYLADCGHIVTGIDISENMIQRAKQLNLPNANFFKTDFFDFHTDKKFDAVIAFDSIWHMQYCQQRQIYGKVAKLLVKGGQFLFTHGLSDGESYGEMYGQQFYYSSIAFEELQRILLETNFQIVQTYKNYVEATTGSRDLLMIVKKK